MPPEINSICVSEKFISRIDETILFSIEKIHLANLGYSNPEKSLDIQIALTHLLHIRQLLNYVLVNKHLYTSR